MKKLGIELSADAIKAQGFVGYMQSVAKVADENVTVMAELFPNVRAIGPALALARDGGSEFVEIFDQIADSSGKVERNFERMTGTLQGQMDVLAGEFERAKITIGEALAPAIQDMVIALAEGMPKIAACCLIKKADASRSAEAMANIMAPNTGLKPARYPSPMPPKEVWAMPPLMKTTLLVTT